MKSETILNHVGNYYRVLEQVTSLENHPHGAHPAAFARETARGTTYWALEELVFMSGKTARSSPRHNLLAVGPEGVMWVSGLAEEFKIAKRLPREIKALLEQEALVG